MKRVIKVLYIMFFIIFFLGLTTSNADYTVTTETDYNTLINNLNNGLWIKSNVMNNNPWIFCRAHGEILPSSGARYTADGPMIQFPNGNNIPSQYYQNRFKIAYVVSRANTNQYTKREIQEAYWTILGQYTASGNAAKLVEIANAYQEYKLQGQQTNIVSENAKLTINSDGTAIYGPIKITFNFRQSNQVKFGGVSYQFCYENGTKIGTYNNNGVATPIIQICKLENGVYSSIDANNTGLIQNTEYSYKSLFEYSVF